MSDVTDNVILIVDDELLIRENFAAYLEDEEFKFFLAGTPEEALEILSNNKIDIAVVDIKLPNHDGNYVILNGYKMSPDTLYLIHTGSSDYEIPDELREIGITDEMLIPKPISSMCDFFEKAHEMRKFLLKK